METKKCPDCGGELILFYPNIPFLTGWYCTNNCGHVEAATEAEIEAELESRAENQSE